VNLAALPSFLKISLMDIINGLLEPFILVVSLDTWVVDAGNLTEVFVLGPTKFNY
jgi:hypothetical protein